jgi:hypothetical protein
MESSKKECQVNGRCGKEYREEGHVWFIAKVDKCRNSENS